MRESKIEKDTCEYAESHGFLVYKIKVEQLNGVTDRMFVAPGGVIFFIEFKQAGKTPRPNQIRFAEKLRGNNVKVYTVDSQIIGKEVIDAHTR